MGNRRRRALAAALLGIAAGAAGADCEPWPGEPAPLPTAADPDPPRARWAALRSAELAERARLAEPEFPLEARRLWTRVFCLDPGSALAREGVRRTAPVRVHQPPFERGAGPAPEPVQARRARSEAKPSGVQGNPSPGLREGDSFAASEPAGGAWASLDQPVALRVAAPAPPPRASAPGARSQPAPAAETAAPLRRQKLEEAERSLRLGEAALGAARFQEALRAATLARDALAELPDGADLAAPRARLEVLAATAQIGLGDEAGAQESLLRAVEAEPGLRLDPARTSPKVLRALELARAARRARR